MTGVLKRAAVFSSVFAAAACSSKPRLAFPIGVLEPVPPRVAAEVRRLGLETSEQAPADAAVVTAVLPVKGGEVAADWAELRFLTARAVAGGSNGIFLRLPSAPAGRDLLEFPEEWQAVTRAIRELVSMKPILQGGEPASAPFPVLAGIELRSWSFHGRLYVLLVNSSDGPIPLQKGSLEPWRALFSVRSDARQGLAPCGKDLCFSAHGVLWLEGRLFPDTLR